MRILQPYLALYKRHQIMLTLGVILAIITLLASIGLLTLSGWFLAATALAGYPGLYTFNFLLPSAGVRGAAILRTAGRYFERLVSHDATFRVLQHLRVFTFSRLLPLSPSGLARFQQGELLNRLVADVDTLDHLYLRVTAPIIGALVVIIVVTIGLSLLNIPLALVLGAIMLLTLLLLTPLFYQAGKPIGVALTQLRASYRQHLTRWLQGQAELTIFNASERYRQQLDNIEQHWQQVQLRQARLTDIAQALMMLISGLTVWLLLWLAADIFHDTQAPAPLIALFVFCGMAAFEALAPATVAFQHMGQVMASAQRVSEIIDQQPDVVFPSSSPSLSEQKPLAEQYSLTLRNISFSYPRQPQPALNNLNLNITPGEHIALLGRTGCGKSTLLQLLTRAYDPTQGEICLNDTAISEFDEATLRRTISVVPQRVHLFSATLRNNLLLAAASASDEQLSAMLTQTGLEKLLQHEGLNAWLGEGGRTLSGGELRRLGIARALLHNAPVMLLDEPTEGLDAGTEQQILALLRTTTAGKTVITVTHRLQGIKGADRIVVLDNGSIIEQGSHTQLLELRGRYYQFTMCQH